MQQLQKKKLFLDAVQRHQSLHMLVNNNNKTKTGKKQGNIYRNLMQIP